MKINLLILKYSNHTILILLSIISICFLYISPYEASSLVITPDSVEYAISAHNLAFDGVFKIFYMNTSFPIRYTPWFSILILTPSFHIFGPEVGNAIIPVMIFGMAGVLAAYQIGKTISNQLGGICCSLVLLSLHVYKRYSKLIMTDIPSTALILIAAYIYIRLAIRKKYEIYNFAFAGLICALSAAFRPVTYSAVLTFILILFCIEIKMKQKILRGIILLIPGFIVFTASCIYNYIFFGNITRNGYNFWCPIPYDYFDLVFSSSYIMQNMKVLLRSPFTVFLSIFILILLLRKKVEKTEEFCLKEKLLLKFLLFSCSPIIIFHLFYFYSEQRFFLPVISLILILALSSLFNFLPSSIIKPKLVPIILCFVLLSSIIYKFFFPSIFFPKRRIIADQIIATTPSDSVIISSIDPIYLNFMTRDRVNSNRFIIPTSRNVEYASKLVMPEKSMPLIPPPEYHLDHRNKRLLNKGAKEAIPFTAVENKNIILNFVKDNRSIYLETSHLSRKEMYFLKKLYSNEFKFQKKSDSLYRMIYSDDSEK